MHRIISFVIIVLLMTAAGLGKPPAAPNKAVLVFSRTAGYRHDSIPDGVKAFQELGREAGFRVEHSEDPGLFTDKYLANFDAVVFLSTTGNVLNDAQQAAFERYIRAGGGYVGVHAASDTEKEWPWYGALVGAYFKSHPPVQRATIDLVDVDHPSTEILPTRWTRTDEWYDFRRNPRGRVHVLATIDEDTYDGATMGRDHPIAWCHEFEGGRSWYTGGGHTRASYSEPLFRSHLLGGIKWAAGYAEGAPGVRTELMQAERGMTGEGAQMARVDDAGEERRVVFFRRSGDFLTLDAVSFEALESIVFRIGSPGGDVAGGGRLEARRGGPNGPQISHVRIGGGPAAGDSGALPRSWHERSIWLDPASAGIAGERLTIIYRGPDAAEPVALDWVRLQRRDHAGVTDR